MLIAEPTTLLTDYAITVEAGFFAVLLYPTKGVEHSIARRWWSMAFGWVAIAAFLGGTYHGFAPFFNQPGSMLLWQSTQAAINLASILVLIATLLPILPPPWHSPLILAATLKFFLLLHWAIPTGDFAITLLDYLITLLFVTLLQVAIPRQQRGQVYWMVGGFLVSCLAAAIEATSLAPCPPLNHNDLYHLVQMIALYFFYRAVINKEP